MRGSVLTKIAVLTVVIIFALGSGLALAAEKAKKADEPWWVIETKDGVCRVEQHKAKTPKAILGPFNSKPEAEKAKAEKCPPKAPVKKQEKKQTPK